MENKVKMQFDIANKEVIKVGKNKVEIKPYISTNELRAITDACLQQFENTDESLKDFALIKTMFDMIVVQLCTNVEVEGIETKESDEGLEISVNLNSQLVIDFEQSLVIYKVKPYIVNYDEAYQTILKVFELKNTYNAFSLFAKNLPSVEQLGDGLKIALESAAELQQKDPETFKQVVKESMTKDIREQSKKELIKSKKNNKSKTATKSKKKK